MEEHFVKMTKGLFKLLNEHRPRDSKLLQKRKAVEVAVIAAAKKAPDADDEWFEQFEYMKKKEVVHSLEEGKAEC